MNPNAPNGPTDPQAHRLFQRLASYAPPATPYSEFSLYGPIHALLSFFFPQHQRWMIKAQAPLGEQEFIPGYPARRDSYDRLLLLQSPIYLKKPDFIVCRYGETMNSDIVRLIIEVKPANNPVKLRKSRRELCWYMNTMLQGLSPARGANNLFGLLICGEVTYRYHMVGGVPTQVGEARVIWDQVVHTWLLQRAGGPIPPLP